MSGPEEKYWVGSNGEEPEQIYFDRFQAQRAAFEGRHRFLDAFDSLGVHIRAYKVSKVELDSTLPDFLAEG